MLLQVRINWFGLAGGIATILLIAVSMFVPWWQLTVGDSIVAAGVSPIYTNFSLIGNSFTVPLLFEAAECRLSNAELRHRRSEVSEIAAT